MRVAAAAARRSAWSSRPPARARCLACDAPRGCARRRRGTMHGPAVRTLRRAALSAAALAVLLPAATGCATRGRVADLERRVDALESRLDSVSATAERAASDAASAPDAAEPAPAGADDAARTAGALSLKALSN